MGNEMGNNNVSGLEEHESDEVEAPNKFSEVLIAASNDNNINTTSHPVSSSKEGDFHERPTDLISEDSSTIDNTEEQVSVGFSRSLISTWEDGFVDEIPSAFEKNRPITSEKPKITPVEAPNESDDTNGNGASSVLSSEDESFHETSSRSHKNLPNKTQIPIRTAPDENTTPMLNGPKDKEIQSASSPEDGCHNEITFASSNSTSDASNHKEHKQMWKEREGTFLTNPSPDMPTLLNSEVVGSDQLKPGNMYSEPYIKDGAKERSVADTLGLNRPLDLQEKGNKLEPETKEVQNEGDFLTSTSEVVKLGDGIQREGIESQIDTRLDTWKVYIQKKSEIEVGEMLKIVLDVESGEDGQQSGNLNSSRKDTLDSKLESVQVTKPLESYQVISLSEKSEEELTEESYSSVCMTTEVRHEYEMSDMEKETAMFDEVSASPADLTLLNPNSGELKLLPSPLSFCGSVVHENVAEAQDVQGYSVDDAEETVIVKPESIDLEPSKPDKMQPGPSVEIPFHDAIQKVSVVATTDCVSPDSDGSYKTAYEQENLSHAVEGGTKSYSYFNNRIADNNSGSELHANKVGVGIGSTSAQAEFSALTQNGETCDGKEVTTLGRSSSGKSNISLLSFLKEEGRLAVSQQEDRVLVATKAIENKRSTTSRRRARSKPRPLFFNVCMCCTTEFP